MNINNGKQNIASFISPRNEANNNIDRPMLENSRASTSGVFIGVLSKYPKLKTSIFRIAGQPFIRWIRVIRSLSNLCLKCNHCISIMHQSIPAVPIPPGHYIVGHFSSLSVPGAGH